MKLTSGKTSGRGGGLRRTLDGANTVVPPQVQEAIDDVVAATHAAASQSNRFGYLCRWIERHTDDHVPFESGSSVLNALAPHHLRARFAEIREEDVRSELELEDDDEVTDAHRVRYFEERSLPALMEDADISSALAGIWLTATDGREAFIADDTQGYSFSGITTTWYGPYRTLEDFESSLAADGWLVNPDGFAGLSFEEKLRMLRG